MDYAAISKQTTGYLYKAYNSLNHENFDQSLRALIELKVSQLNGCAYCCRVHQAEALKAGVSEEKIDALQHWETASVFSDKERAALKLAELVTATPKESKAYIQDLGELFTEREIVDLTLCISIMNALNRMAISFR